MNAIQLKTRRLDGLVIKFVFSEYNSILKAVENCKDAKGIYYGSLFHLFHIVETKENVVKSLTIYWTVNFHVESLSLDSTLKELLAYLKFNQINGSDKLCDIVGITNDDIYDLVNLGVYTIKLVTI